MSYNNQQNAPAAIHQLAAIIDEQRESFDIALSDDRISFPREAQFAIQHLRNNDFLAKTAQRNPESLRDAVKNVAAIGISLNPADKHAYLVPRDNKVCLDISYLGLIHIATESGAVAWVQAKHVHENDVYESNGVDKAPTHNYSPFKPRGSVVGVYCVAKTTGGDYLTTEMDIAEVNRIKARSPSANKGFSPWKSDEGQMQLKTVIKRGYKQWPKSERLSAAVDYMNNHGEGIDFAAEQRRSTQSHGDPVPSPEQKREMDQLLSDTGTDPDMFYNYLNQVLRANSADLISSMDSMTGKEADQAIGMLRQKLAQMKAKQAAREQQQTQTEE